MRKIRSLILFLLVSVLLGVLTNCQEEEAFNTGTLSLTFSNHSPEMYAEVFAIDNLSIPIDNIPIYNKRTERILNIGNYYIEIYSPTSSFSSIGFQVKPQTTTSIRWDDNNRAILVE